MSWEKLLKIDPCTLEAKEMLYQVLQKMGANNDLLENLRTNTDEDIRTMLEDFSMTSPQKDIFKALLKNWDMCIVESKRNPNTPQVEMDDSDMYKILKRGKPLNRPALKEAIKETADNMADENGSIYTTDAFYRQIQEKYKENLLNMVGESGNNKGWIGSHVKFKATPDRIKNIVGKYLPTFDYIKVRKDQFGAGSLWRKRQ
ncbi:MAG: hypothetical protein GOVbin1753_25 [Prokaryotic dsDNA virus sp.]|nr:MAG: hypothetical protein GOVbin1753_25 [Prokaryotic dsDNA virus sp.]|tara:strand:+ start:806 stop:1411 length:606 start_codon:yes stop_codon:yes gene_type:complete